ncbi:MAG: efflux RND transporter permease subunit [Phaeodactylibacter sp.]|nr:efflux RND transporter permease subunit [Phaeodactylibacter sp.]MCB9276846.1 efflux RND transporter permease subunit [Lewinellaceae bacterium]
MSITELSVKRPTLVVVLFTILCFFGLVGYQSLTYELLPDISSPVISITTVYPGASPEEVENAVAKEIEEAVSTLENLDKLQSISMEGVSTVIVQFKYGADIDQLVQDAQRKVDAIRAKLPEDALDPSIGKFSLDELPIMRIGATSNMDEVAFTGLFENRIQPELARIEGVAQVKVVGGESREIQVNVDGDKLKYYNLSLLQVTQAINNANMDFPTGSVRNKDQDILVRLSGKIRDLGVLRQLVLTTKDGAPVYLQDVAEVHDFKKEAEAISRINGQSSLGVLITKQSDGNTVEVADNVKAELKKMEERYAAEKLQFNIAQDSSVFTLQAADAVIHDLVIAVILVAVIMLLFLHSFRNALIVMVAIPVSIVTTFAVMSVAGFTLNLMTLLALSLVVGILVDDSIVVLENIHSHQERGKSPIQAAIAVWDEMGLSVMSITLVIIVVFLPIAMVTGLISDLLFQFSLVVVASTAISLLVSFTLTPFLASRFSRLKHLDANKLLDRPLIWFESVITGLQDSYEAALKWSLRHKVIAITGIFALVAASFALLANGFIGSEFVNAGDNGEFQITIELPKEAPLERTNYLTQQIEARLLHEPEVVSVFTTVGQSSGRLSNTSSSNLAELNVKLVPAEQRSLSSAEYADEVKHSLLENIPGAKISVAPVSMVGGGGSAPIQIILQGSGLNELMAFGEQVQELVKKVPGTTEVKSTVEGGNPEISVNIDRERMAGLGLSLNVVGATMQNAFTGNTDSKFEGGDYDYDIRVQLDAFDRRNMEDIQNLNFLNNQGNLIKLSQFATVAPSTGPSRLERQDKITSLTVESRVVGRAEGTVGQEIREMLAQTETPAGIEVSFGGNLEQQEDSFRSLGFALLTSILLVYLIMVALYDSYVYPFVVMFSIPVALIGAFLALALAMQNMSIFGMLGLIMLVGLVVKNAILIVDFVNQLKKEGMPSREAVVKGTMARFRPILMTTIAMVIAMIPIAIAKGAGSEWKNGLAWVLIGGLTSSMILTLIIVPVMYRVVDGAKEWFAKRRKKEKAGNLAPVHSCMAE